MSVIYNLDEEKFEVNGAVFDNEITDNNQQGTLWLHVRLDDHSQWYLEAFMKAEDEVTMISEGFRNRDGKITELKPATNDPALIRVKLELSPYVDLRAIKI